MPKIKVMPDTAYRRTVATVRDYPRMVAEVQRLKNDTASVKSTVYSDMPKGRAPSTMADKVATIADMEQSISCIQRALESLPPDLRQGVYNNVVYGVRFPHVPSLSTWERNKRRFLLQAAKNMRFL